MGVFTTHIFLVTLSEHTLQVMLKQNIPLYTVAACALCASIHINNYLGEREWMLFMVWAVYSSLAPGDTCFSLNPD